MARPNETTKALAELNAARGLTYPMTGYTYWADIKGDGRYRPSVWVIINDQGGVTYSTLNHERGAKRVERIREATREALRVTTEG